MSKIKISPFGKNMAVLLRRYEEIVVLLKGGIASSVIAKRLPFSYRRFKSFLELRAEISVTEMTLLFDVFGRYVIQKLLDEPLTVMPQDQIYDYLKESAKEQLEKESLELAAYIDAHKERTSILKKMIDSSSTDLETATSISRDDEGESKSSSESKSSGDNDDEVGRSTQRIIGDMKELSSPVDLEPPFVEKRKKGLFGMGS